MKPYSLFYLGSTGITSFDFNSVCYRQPYFVILSSISIILKFLTLCEPISIPNSNFQSQHSYFISLPSTLRKALPHYFGSKPSPPLR